MKKGKNERIREIWLIAVGHEHNITADAVEIQARANEPVGEVIVAPVVTGVAPTVVFREPHDPREVIDERSPDVEPKDCADDATGQGEMPLAERVRCCHPLDKGLLALAVSRVARDEVRSDRVVKVGAVIEH